MNEEVGGLPEVCGLYVYIELPDNESTSKALFLLPLLHHHNAYIQMIRGKTTRLWVRHK